MNNIAMLYRSQLRAEYIAFAQPNEHDHDNNNSNIHEASSDVSDDNSMYI